VANIEYNEKLRGSGHKIVVTLEDMPGRPWKLFYHATGTAM